MATQFADVTVYCSVCASTGRLVTTWLDMDCPYCRKERVKEYDRRIELELIEEQEVV